MRMVARQTKPKKKKGKAYKVEISIKSMFFWGLGLFFLLAWIFVLGILVGRGFFAERVTTITELKTQIIKLQDMLTREDLSDIDSILGREEDPEFAFYDELSVRKRDLAKKKRTTATRVRVEKAPAKEKNPAEAGQGYTLQFASLDTESGAEEMANRLRSQGYPAYFYRVSIKGKTYYRVRCGKFKTRKEACKFQESLAEQEVITGFVTRVDK